MYKKWGSILFDHRSFNTDKCMYVHINKLFLINIFTKYISRTQTENVYIYFILHSVENIYNGTIEIRVVQADMFSAAKRWL